MPAYMDQPAIFGDTTVEDVTRLSKLPFFQVMNEVKQFPAWNIFDQLYGSIPWKPNMGDVMQGSTPQRSPVSRSFFFPNAVIALSNKDVYQVTESLERAQVYAHEYESFQFNFVPSFDVFWRDYIQFNNTDIVSKIAVSNNQFIETNMYFNASYMYLCGTGLIGGCPTGMGNAAGNAPNSKTAAWLLATVSGVLGNPGVQQNFTLRDAFSAMMNLQEDLAAPPFEKALNMPKDNEGLKGRYVIVCSSEVFLNWTFDPDVQTLKPLELNLLFNDFKGLLFGTTTVKINRYPIRFSLVNILDAAGNVAVAAGTPIPPEIFDATDNKWKPNPSYTSLAIAPYEIAWMLGSSYAKTIKVGPPPKEFATTKMSAQKFYSMKWNGEVRLTDQILIQMPNNQYKLNTYGEQLKFISKCTHGYLVGERRYAFPIILLRKRPARLLA